MTALTPRELDVLRLLRDGREIGQAAHELRISEGRVRRLAASARHKLRASNSTHAVAVAISTGELGPVGTA